VAYDIEETKK